MRINKESCRQALEVMLETYSVWNDASKKASLLPVIAVLAIGAGHEGLDVPVDDDSWDEQISLTPEGEAALLADVVEGPGLPAPFDGAEWNGWKIDPNCTFGVIRHAKKLGVFVVVTYGAEYGFQVLGTSAKPIFKSAVSALEYAEAVVNGYGGWA